jgi:hypothetical protein
MFGAGLRTGQNAEAVRLMVVVIGHDAFGVKDPDGDQENSLQQGEGRNHEIKVASTLEGTDGVLCQAGVWAIKVESVDMMQGYPKYGILNPLVGLVVHTDDQCVTSAKALCFFLRAI